MATDFQEKGRRLRNAVEPVAAGMNFAPMNAGPRAREEHAGQAS